MRLTFLGTGTSAGVPVIGAVGGANDSDDPRDNRLRTSACLRFVDGGGQERVILIDCSPDMRQQALREGLLRCDGILFTHTHVDHCWGLDEVRRFNALMEQAIDIYAEPRSIEHLRRVYAHIFDQAKNVNASFVATVIAHTIEPERPYEMFGLRVTPIRLLHGRLPVLGFRFDAVDGARIEGLPGPLPLAYCTDVNAIPPETWPHLEGLKTLVLDCLRYRHHPTHLTVGQATGIAHRVGAERTLFVHMSYDIVHAELEAELPEGMELAYDGLTV
ncbi:MAG: MBL fold metallo-hydrolase [Planctomycetota bacterium]